MLSLKNEKMTATAVIGENAEGVRFPLLHVMPFDEYYFADVKHDEDGRASNHPVFTENDDDPGRPIAVDMEGCRLIEDFEDIEFVRLCESFYRGVDPDRVSPSEEETK